MAFKDVMALRKAGNLDDALKVAKEDFLANPDNLFHKRALAWVFYDFLKRAANEEKYEFFVEVLKDIGKLNLPADDKMIFDQCAFQICKVVYALYRQNPVNFNLINAIFDQIKTFNFSRPSESWSALLKAFHKGNKTWPRYMEFVDWWGMDNFLAADFREEIFNDKKSMALVEKTYIAYARHMLNALSGPHPSLMPDSSYVQSFIERLEKLVDNHPKFLYPLYYLVKLLMATNASQQYLYEKFLPFARKKRNEFWVWELMADIFKADLNHQTACYCKAFTLNTQEKFLVKLRQKFVSLLLTQKLYDEARWQVDKIVKVRTANNWKLPPILVQWKGQSWYTQAEEIDGVDHLYHRFIPLAEQLLFYDITEETVVVTNVNKEKQVFNFIKESLRVGFAKYRSLIDDIQPYDILKVRFMKEETSGFAKMYTIRKDNSAGTSLIRHFEGELQRHPSLPIGFVDEVFISEKLMHRYQLEPKVNIKGLAVRAFNKKKNAWGWTAFKIESC